jgi:hypothetical protein
MLQMVECGRRPLAYRRWTCSAFIQIRGEREERKGQIFMVEGMVRKG